VPDGVSQENRSQHFAVPWTQIAALRNRLIHGYDEVNLDILWDIIDRDLPPLAAELQAIVEGGTSEGPR